MEKKLKELIDEVIENKSYYEDSEDYIEYVFAMNNVKLIRESLRKFCTYLEMKTEGNFFGEFGNMTEYEIFFMYYKIDIDDFCFCIQYVKNGNIYEIERITFKIRKDFLHENYFDCM